jgi:hypothetical protein
MAKKPKKMKPTWTTVFSVEEVEDMDGSVSTEFNSMEEAEAHLKKIVKKPAYGVTAYRIWVSMCIHEEPRKY